MKRKLVDALLILLYMVCIPFMIALWAAGSAGALIEWVCDTVTTWWANGYTELSKWARGGYYDL